MTPRKKLTDILHGGDRERIAAVFDRADAAEDFQPLPGGDYEAHVVGLELFESRNGTPGVKLSFRVCDGPHTGRLFWSDLWLTAAALPMAKRDLAKLGITALEQLEGDLPQGIRCRCKVTLRRDDDGNEFNRLRKFDVVGIDTPQADPFAPTDDVGQDTDTDASDPTSFDVAQLEAELQAEAAAAEDGESEGRAA
ncbi:MAG TPA: DUF669 domain-containing protein [Phycisphaerae bacterium]|nr:DUF669 domain-containing protein [Phycisphaerae bacterium]HRW51800.1 DUF669 domain-containing protein [Phycisphaerae bacterium]